MESDISAPGASGAASLYPLMCSEALAAEIRQIEGPLRCISGATLYARAIHPDDGARLQSFHQHLSTDSIVFRFFRFMPALPDQEAERLTHLDYERRMALVAVEPQTPATGAGEPGASADIVGVVRYERLQEDTAEVAFIITDKWQGQGIATALLHRLAAYARRRGITTLIAVTMSGNARMFEVLRHAGYPLALRHDADEVSVRLDITQPTRGEPEIHPPVLSPQSITQSR